MIQYILNLYKDQTKNITGFLGDPKGKWEFLGKFWENNLLEQKFVLKSIRIGPNTCKIKDLSYHLQKNKIKLIKLKDFHVTLA